jgi:hypothetical protein
MVKIGWKVWFLTGLALVMLLAPTATAATIDYHYESWTVAGHTTSGVFDYEEYYTVPCGTGRTWLDPYPPTLLNAAAGTATTANSKIDTFYEALISEFGDSWSFTESPTELTGVFDVHTYDAVGTPAAVGADFHVEYRPVAGASLGNLHWIQVVFTNHPLRGSTTGHGSDAAYVDIGNAQSNPYYDDGGASAYDNAGDFHFYDAPRRTDVCNAHYWYADLFLVSGPPATTTQEGTTFPPGEVIILGGIRWGWKNQIIPEPATLALLGIALAAMAARNRHRTTANT